MRCEYRPVRSPGGALHATFRLRRLGRGKRYLPCYALRLRCGFFDGYFSRSHTERMLALLSVEMADPTRSTKQGLRSALKLATTLGFLGGFLLAYQRSSCMSSYFLRHPSG